MEKITLEQIWLEMKNMSNRLDKRFDRLEKRIEKMETNLTVIRQDSALLTESSAEHDKNIRFMTDLIHVCRRHQDNLEVQINQLERVNRSRAQY